MIADRLWDSVVLALPFRAQDGSSSIYDLKDNTIRLVPNGLTYPLILKSSNGEDGVLYMQEPLMGVEVRPSSNLDVFENDYCLDFLVTAMTSARAPAVSLYDASGVESLRIDCSLTEAQVLAYGNPIFTTADMSGVHLNHIALCKDGAATLMYLNGNLIGETTAPDIHAVGLVIGCSTFIGHVTNVRLTSNKRFTGPFTPTNHPLDLRINDDPHWDNVVLASTMDNYAYDPHYDKIIGYYKADNPALPGMDSGPRGNHIIQSLEITTDAIVGNGSWLKHLFTGYSFTLGPTVPEMVFGGDFCIEINFKSVNMNVSSGMALGPAPVSDGNQLSITYTSMSMNWTSLGVSGSINTDPLLVPSSLCIQRRGSTVSLFLNGVLVDENQNTDYVNFNNFGSRPNNPNGGIIVFDEIRYTAAARYISDYDHLDVLPKLATADDLLLTRHTVVNQSDLAMNKKLGFASSGYVEYDHKPEFAMSNQFTVEGYFTPISISEDQRYLVYILDQDGADSQFAISYTASSISIHTSQDGVVVHVDTFEHPFGAWFEYNVAVSVDDTLMRCFINGVLIGSAPSRLPFHASSKPLLIGGSPLGGASCQSELSSWVITKEALYTENYTPRHKTRYSGYVTGTVLSAGSETPSAKVRIYNRDTGIKISEGYTNTNGVFNLPAPLGVDLMVVAMDPESGVAYNDVVYSMVRAE